MAAPRSHVLGLSALLLAVLALHPGARAQAAGPATKSMSKGAALLRWMGREMPEVALKLVSCVKKNERDAREAAMSLFTDVAKCFDETKGSVLYTTECMLRNGVARVLNVITVLHKVAGCAVKNKKDGRLCITPTTVNDEACPFAFGI